VAGDDDRRGHIQQPADHGHDTATGGLRRDEQVQDRDGGRDNQERAGDLPDAAVGLLANALEVAPPASQITLTGGRSRDLVELHVIDQGPA
jgi:hypothetical protein